MDVWISFPSVIHKIIMMIVTIVSHIFYCHEGDKKIHGCVINLQLSLFPNMPVVMKTYNDDIGRYSLLINKIRAAIGRLLLIF